MRESWRWFGENDPVSLDDIRQAGATDIVSALHNIPIGDIWNIEAIKRHQDTIENSSPELNPLTWSVVESIPVHESIKLAQPEAQVFIDNWIRSMENLAKCGIKVICYNFMPVIDWTRTDLKFRMPSGAYALRFDHQAFAAFDLFILQRDEAAKDYSGQEYREAEEFFSQMSDSEKSALTENIIAGLPGRMTDSYGLEGFREQLTHYKQIDRDTLRDNLVAFLTQVLPVAESLGVKLAIHPDDPPRSLLGLPRSVCTADDLEILFQRLPSPSNGMTLCVGTFGSRPDNNLPEMAKRFGPRIYFSHLRGVTLDKDEPRSFYEANHLDSDIDMVSVVNELLNEESARRKNQDSREIYIRPDHGHQMMDDIHKQVNPGYSGIGRLKGLAEIRGVIRALSATIAE